MHRSAHVGVIFADAVARVHAVPHPGPSHRFPTPTIVPSPVLVNTHRGRLRGRRSVDRMPPEPPATLAAWLRTRSDEQLGALLVARPDVARPAPSDVVALASRLAVPVSVDRALDELDAATLQVLDVVLLAPTDGVAADQLPAALPDLPDAVLSAGLEQLTTRALLWGDELLRAPDPVRRSVRHPAGLGRRATELRLQLPADLAGAIDESDPEERAVLERLAG